MCDLFGCCICFAHVLACVWLMRGEVITLYEQSGFVEMLSDGLDRRRELQERRRPFTYNVIKLLA